MSVGNLTLRWSGILMGILFMAVVLTACGDDSAGSTSTINGDSGPWDEYEAFCSEAAQEELDDNEDYTNGEVSTFYAELVERMESIDPPVEIANWHDRVLAAWTAVTRLIDAEPQDAIFDPLILFSDNEILSRFGEVEEAFNEIPADVRERLAAAGCSDGADSEPTVTATSTATPTVTPTPGQIAAETATPRPEPTSTPLPTIAPTLIPKATPTVTSTSGPIATAIPTSTPTSISRDDFEKNTPLGYKSVDLGDSGSVWGHPGRFTSDSSDGTVAYMLLGTIAGCNIADAEADRSSKAYIKIQSLGPLTGYESVSVCRFSSKTWNSWDGVRVTHLRVFDESSPSNVREYVYDDATGRYVETTSYTVDPKAVPTAQPTPIPTAQPTARDRDGDGLIEVDNLTQVDAIRWDLDGDGISDDADYAAAFPDANTGTLCSVESCAGYELTANLDFDTNGNGEADEGDAYWNSGAGWIPIGEGSPFVATFEGGGHTISNLYIRRSPNVGLFGVLGSGSTVSGIGLVATSVGASGYGSAGALAGIGHGVIEDSFADGLVAGCVDEIGGLVGVNEGSIANSRSAVDVINAGKSHEAAFVVITEVITDLIDIPLFISSRLACYGSVGGLVGDNKGTIAGSHSTSVVSGLTDNLGGLVGVNSGAITDSYATGSVSGKGFADLGGLVGANAIEGKIITSYATGGVSGQGDNFGGLAGVNSGVIAASYAAGSVSGNGYADVGGLVGDNGFTGVITAAYAEGSVSGRADRYGGLLGSNQGLVSFCFSTGEAPQGGGGLIDSNGNYGTVANCYWDTETSNQSDSAGGDGKTTAGLQSPTGYTGAYADWNVDLDGDGSSDDPWRFGSATEYPVLKLGTIEIDRGNLNTRPPLEDKRNKALCSAVNYAEIEKVNARIKAGIDVNDTCQSATAWYDGLTPLAIAKKQGGPAVEAILVEAGAVNAEN